MILDVKYYENEGVDFKNLPMLMRKNILNTTITVCLFRLELRHKQLLQMKTIKNVKRIDDF